MIQIVTIFALFSGNFFYILVWYVLEYVLQTYIKSSEFFSPKLNKRCVFTRKCSFKYIFVEPLRIHGGIIWSWWQNQFCYYVMPGKASTNVVFLSYFLNLWTPPPSVHLGMKMSLLAQKNQFFKSKNNGQQNFT